METTASIGNCPELVEEYDNCDRAEDTGCTSHTADVPKNKKKRKSVADDKAEKLSCSAISDYLTSVQRSAYQCCSFLCFSWLTTAVVLFCRGKYVLIDSSKGRRQWIEEQLQQMETYTHKRLLYAYVIETMEGEKRRCCGPAWEFAYGVCSRSKERASTRRRKHTNSTSPKRTAPSKNKGTKHREMFAAAWLKRYARMIGDQLPFGDSHSETEIRLPFGNKKMVYEAYHQSINEDPTKLLNPCSYDEFVGMWKNRQDLKHVKCAKFKPGFAKCDTCDRFSEQLKKKLDPIAKDQVELELRTHIQEERLEREQYYIARAKAADRSDKYLSIIIDSMDQKKTCVPYFLNPPKCLGSDYFLKTKLTSAIVHGHGTYHFWSSPEIKHDTNLSLECLRRTLLKYQQEKRGLPPVLYLQLDNAPDNKSKRFLAFIGYLIEKKVFKKIKVSYLIVGHTHEDIDSLFSAISRYFKNCLKRVLTIEGFV
jgi:hypothetical protein